MIREKFCMWEHYITGLDRPAAHPTSRLPDGAKTTPRSPKGCGVKIPGRFHVELQAAAFMYISNWVDAGIV